MKLSYGDAIREALFREMSQDENVVMFGQDIRHNLYGYTKNLANEFGLERIIDTPLSESAVVGTAIGAAMTGMKTIVDLTVSSFLYVAMDQIVSMAAKTRYMYNGQFKVPLTILCSSMYKACNAAQHSDRPHPMLMNVPGLKIVAPATPQDAYSLLRSSIADDGPVIYFTDRSLFYNQQEVDFDLSVDIGCAKLIHGGSNVTIVAISGMADVVISMIDELKREGIFADVIDVRSLVPLDMAMILDSVSKTGRLVIIDTAHKRCSAASEIASIVAEEGFRWLKAPIGIVAYEDIPVPFSRELELLLSPTNEKIYNKVRTVTFY